VRAHLRGDDAVEERFEIRPGSGLGEGWSRNEKGEPEDDEPHDLLLVMESRSAGSYPVFDGGGREL
jgi:hypothetical protein